MITEHLAGHHHHSPPQWASARLEARRLENNGHCPLCQGMQEMGIHLFKDCRFTKCIWEGLAEWPNNFFLQPDNWAPGLGVATVGTAQLSATPSATRKDLRTLVILTCCRYGERNTRIFEQRELTNTMLLQKIKDEASLWVMAGAKHLGSVIYRSWVSVSFAIVPWHVHNLLACVGFPFLI